MWNAWLVMNELADSGATWKPAIELILDDLRDNTMTGWGDPARIQQEIRDLARAARDERPEALGEILSQNVEIITDFMGLLYMTPGSHPQTYRVMHIAILAATFGVMHFKGVYERIRPSQIAPALMPPIPNPGHSAFPSGHATQAYLMAECLARVIEGSSVPSIGPVDEQLVFRRNLFVLARRIARNREIAGLHYASDSEGGRVLAEELRKALIGLPRFDAAIMAAQGEWV